MELDWEEKKIQALFSELRTAEEPVTPRFAPMWNRAQLASRRVRAFNPAFVAATLLLVFGLVSLGVWSQYSQRTQPPAVAKVTAPAVVNAPPAPATVKSDSGPDKVGPATAPRNLKRTRPIRFRSEERTLMVSNQKLTREAKALSSWSSPTSALLTSSSNEIFTSLPQLNKSASDLKSFLPSRSN
ncbi:MAG TPA: hypothetical protein VIU65_11545 [Pyrinomonadaceae bacterium]